MHYLRALTIATITYISTLGLGLLTLLIIGIHINPDVAPSGGTLLFSMILGMVLTTISAVAYFLPPATHGGARQGFAYGGIATLVGFGCDGLLWLIGHAVGVNPAPIIHAAYTHWFLGIMIAATIALCGIVGAAKTRHQGYEASA